MNNNLAKFIAKLGMKLTLSALQQIASTTPPASNPSPSPAQPNLYKNKDFFIRNINGQPVLLGYKGTDNFVFVPDVVNVYPNTFRSNSMIYHVVFPESVFRIYTHCFVNCQNLTSINILNPHCQVSNALFLNCPNVSSICIHGKNLDILCSDKCELKVSLRYLHAKDHDEEINVLLASMNTGLIQKFIVAIDMLRRYQNDEFAEEFLKYRIHEALKAVAIDPKSISFLLERFGQYVYPTVFPKLIEYTRKNNLVESQLLFMKYCHENSIDTSNTNNLSL